MDEAPPSAASSAMQDALRSLMAETMSHAATGARVEAVAATVAALAAKVDRHLADSERDRADAEKDRDELRAALARIEVDLRRFADAKAAMAQLAVKEQEQQQSAASAAEAKWRTRTAPLVGMVGIIVLVLERLAQRLMGTP